MKLIYKDNRYPCILKSEMEKNMWYSMEPVKLTVTIPLVEYFNMRTDITECDNEFHFRLLVDKNDKVNNFSDDFISGLWIVDSQFERSTITSRFGKGVVNVIFKLHISERELSDKSELRDLIMNDLFKK
jgi:hypothetical protein